MKIITKYQNGRKYYYLRLGFRRNKKVITRDKYLGKKLPPEVEINKIKKILLQERNLDLNNKLKVIKENFQKEWRTFPESIKEKELQEIAIAFTYNTNAIEGSTITFEETKELLEHKISPNKPIRDVKETEAHAKVFFEMLRIKQELTKQILLNWHKEIFSETKPDIAGKFRDYLVRIGDHLAPDWQDVEALMLDLMRQIDNKPKGEEIIKFAAAIHYRFEKIHPFGDGNGRIGRLILNFLIWHAGYPMLIVTYKKRKSYNNAFKKDEENFIKYFLRYYLSIHKKRYLKSTS